MKKTLYMKPAIEISQAEVEEILAVSIISTQTPGLGDNENLDYDDTGANPWDDAW